LSKSLPDALYVYRVYCGGTVVRLLTEHHTLEDLWAAILEARKSEDPVLWCWCPPAANGDYPRFCLDATAVVGVQDNDGSLQQPKVREQRRAASSRQARMVGGRVNIGTQAKKHSGIKKR